MGNPYCPNCGHNMVIKYLDLDLGEDETTKKLRLGRSAYFVCPNGKNDKSCRNQKFKVGAEIIRKKTYGQLADEQAAHIVVGGK